jgi:hypothetical protein
MKPFRPHLSVLATVLACLLGCNWIARPAPAHAAPDLGATDAPALAPTTQQAIEALSRAQRRDLEEMRQAVYYLASDELEGRGVMTEGLDKAADHIAGVFRSAGVKRLPGAKSYFQPFNISLSTTAGERTSLSAGELTFEINTDFTPMGLSTEDQFSGEVAFVGYSVSSPEHRYDDFEGVDVKGKVALALRYEPMDESGKSRFDPDGRTDHATFTAKAKAAAAHGAVALLIVNPPNLPDPDQLQPMGRSGGPKADIPVIQITRASANRILKMAGAKDLKTMQSEIDAETRPQSFVMEEVTVNGEVQLQRDQREVKNVMGYLPGRGAGRDEYIVIGAHYDHLGRGETGSLSMIGRRQIHNGADDNASGTAVMMQLARRLSKMPRDRSVIFIAFTGEERGLLGSQHWVNNAPVPLDKIVAMINLDMVGRLQNNTLEVGGTGTAEEFDSIVEAVNENSPLNFKPASSRVGGRGGVGPSDHASFAGKRIPVMFLWTGNHIDYHRPTDTADKVNYVGMVHILDLTVQLVDSLMKLPPTQYVDKYDRSGMASGAMRVRLGIMPDYSSEDEGVKVGSTMPNTPAAQAGIEDGDLIVQIGDEKVTSLTDYMSALNKQKPGDTITIGVLRNGERHDLQTTFPGQRG